MKLAYIFPGQGAQYVGMGSELRQKYPAAAKVFQEADEVLGYGLSELCFTGPAETLRLTYHTQPAILTTSVAALFVFAELAEVQPVCTAGHSLGEYTALVGSGMLDFASAVKLVHLRGKWMDEAVPAGVGAMSAVLGMDRDVLAAVCSQASGEDEVAQLANINCPGQIVISGTTAAVASAGELAKEHGAKRVIPLDVSGPFHSSLMKPASERLRQALVDTRFTPTDIPVVQNVDAALRRDPDAVRKGLEEQLFQSVLWEDDVRTMLELGVDAFVEFGPGTVLSGLVRKIARGIPTYHVEDEASLRQTLQAVRG